MGQVPAVWPLSAQLQGHPACNSVCSCALQQPCRTLHPWQQGECKQSKQAKCPFVPCVHCGVFCQVVAEVLLRKGRQTFAELLRNVNSGSRTSRQLHLSSSNGGSQQGPTLTSSQLKQVLLVLIQQNCIITRLQPAEVMVTGVRPAVHIYEADLPQMLQLIRCAH